MRALSFESFFAVTRVHLGYEPAAPRASVSKRSRAPELVGEERRRDVLRAPVGKIRDARARLGARRRARRRDGHPRRGDDRQILEDSSRPATKPSRARRGPDLPVRILRKRALICQALGQIRKSGRGSLPGRRLRIRPRSGRVACSRWSRWRSRGRRASARLPASRGRLRRPGERRTSGGSEIARAARTRLVSRRTKRAPISQHVLSQSLPRGGSRSGALREVRRGPRYDRRESGGAAESCGALAQGRAVTRRGRSTIAAPWSLDSRDHAVPIPRGFGRRPVILFPSPHELRGRSAPGGRSGSR